MDVKVGRIIIRITQTDKVREEDTDNIFRRNGE
jgi:hypothetical protein